MKSQRANLHRINLCSIWSLSKLELNNKFVEDKKIHKLSPHKFHFTNSNSTKFKNQRTLTSCMFLVAMIPRSQFLHYDSGVLRWFSVARFSQWKQPSHNREIVNEILPVRMDDLNFMLSQSLDIAVSLSFVRMMCCVTRWVEREHAIC